MPCCFTHEPSVHERRTHVKAIYRWVVIRGGGEELATCKGLLSWATGQEEGGLNSRNSSARADQMKTAVAPFGGVRRLSISRRCSASQAQVNVPGVLQFSLSPILLPSTPMMEGG